MIFWEFCKVKTIQNSERERERERERDREKAVFVYRFVVSQSLRITVTDAEDIFLTIAFSDFASSSQGYSGYEYMTYVPKVHII